MFEFEPFIPNSKSGRVHINSSPEMVEAKTEWIWAKDIPGSDYKKGEPVYKGYRKTIFKHWVNMGWAKEFEPPVEQLTLF
ncbi:MULTISPECIES: hypothetical protein [Paenibacillus]|uniref:hypothetical protein n=1 Tax=Paenibacillus TaxID=44249 RepID=UPI00096DD8EF|nr:hypothetical protein [Paenibacillus odorifer]OME18740.1 hypothetical protein BSK60_01485 [Paenibacillus odorifer]OME62270.1 hypothetical protein BSK59_02025 [Paenibacillus odorifer]